MEVGVDFFVVLGVAFFARFGALELDAAFFMRFGALELEAAFFMRFGTLELEAVDALAFLSPALGAAVFSRFLPLELAWFGRFVPLLATVSGPMSARYHARFSAHFVPRISSMRPARAMFGFKSPTAKGESVPTT